MFWVLESIFIISSGESHVVARPILCSVHFTLLPFSRSYTTGGAQCGEDCRDDACKDLQYCFPTFFLHCRLVFDVNTVFGFC